MTKEVGLSSQQMATVLSYRGAIQQERRNLLQLEAMVLRLKEHIFQHLTSLNNKMEKLQTVLTPLQLVKFYAWVEKNEWSMQILNTVWTSDQQAAPGVKGAAPQQQQHRGGPAQSPTSRR